jgi:hypothetical protein
MLRGTAGRGGTNSERGRSEKFHRYLIASCVDATLPSTDRTVGTTVETIVQNRLRSDASDPIEVARYTTSHSPPLR